MFFLLVFDPLIHSLLGGQSNIASRFHATQNGVQDLLNSMGVD